ncbi:High-affinity zinc uptake system protein ZnuA precursor [Marinomonas gallaica]|uniref:High-affinity zinc uptake system protein ZnuA n=1 Tax=Marinomonas gallaica TaxID=1806667 RepID=A0A1C3JMT1_9GAMM|nr:zinc ABC transporter substrate-binding protein [Marinomonas gallaica]SBT16558.1 High-affinity zinc uptake system protein ZnuA precursor [Marinomonas gallaica]SBT20274.1 High-affinity zinc uptake system protein ZnuA precursor [Marinomonas gallaica]
MFKYVLPASLLLSVSAFAQTQVVTSVKPVSMIVSAIGGEHIEVQQLVSNQASPHDFAMRPSDLRKLDQADLVVWVGESLETFMEKPLANLSAKKDLEWMALNDAFLREFGDKEAHNHDEHHEDHDHDEHHEDHDHDEHHEDHDHDERHEDHDHDEHHEDHDHDEHHEDHDHDEHHEEHGHEGHDHSGTDPHVWLDPVNAKVLAKAVTERLISIDPEHKQDYQTNFQAFMSSVEHADHDVAERLAGVAEVPYFVFHEAYGYFENHYGLNNKGAIALSPERKPGAKTVAHIREEIEEHNVSCVFSEPQFSPAIVETLIDGTNVKTAVLDPLGTNVELGADSYAMFLTGLADQYISCLK